MNAKERRQCESTSGREKITSLTHETQSVMVILPGRDWVLGTLSPLLIICMSVEFKTPLIRKYLVVF